MPASAALFAGLMRSLKGDRPKGGAARHPHQGKGRARRWSLPILADGGLTDLFRGLQSRLRLRDLRQAGRVVEGVVGHLGSAVVLSRPAVLRVGAVDVAFGLPQL